MGVGVQMAACLPFMPSTPCVTFLDPGPPAGLLVCQLREKGWTLRAEQTFVLLSLLGSRCERPWLQQRLLRLAVFWALSASFRPHQDPVG